MHLLDEGRRNGACPVSSNCSAKYRCRPRCRCRCNAGAAQEASRQAAILRRVNIDVPPACVELTCVHLSHPTHSLFLPFFIHHFSDLPLVSTPTHPPTPSKSPAIVIPPQHPLHTTEAIRTSGACHRQRLMTRSARSAQLGLPPGTKPSMPCTWISWAILPARSCSPSMVTP